MIVVALWWWFREHGAITAKTVIALDVPPTAWLDERYGDGFGQQWRPPHAQAAVGGVNKDGAV
ncbi:MAG: hypothetical protein Q4Q03_05755 [Bowdeniella nasicola]|nr:hypothetical protein [Bowdeniella nasicola]